MNSTRIAAYLCLSLGLLTFALSRPAQAQFRETISLDITQRGELGGGISYGLQTIPLPFRTTLIAPDGTSGRFGINGLTFSELASRFIGTWTIRETSFSPPNQVSEHTFTLSPFEPSDLFNDTPVITTPADLSVVPTSFPLEWSYVGGAMPNSRLVSRSMPTGNSDVTFAPSPHNRVDFSVDLEGRGPTTLTVRAGTTVNLDSYLSPVTLISGPVRTEYTVSSRFQLLSEPVRLTVVPEPHSMWLAAVGAAILLGQARRRANIDRGSKRS
jgi:hypothetical protein